MSNASIRSGFFRYSEEVKNRALEKTKALFDILLLLYRWPKVRPWSAYRCGHWSPG